MEIILGIYTFYYFIDTLTCNGIVLTITYTALVGGVKGGGFFRPPVLHCQLLLELERPAI